VTLGKCDSESGYTCLKRFLYYAQVDVREVSMSCVSFFVSSPKEVEARTAFINDAYIFTGVFTTKLC